MKEFEWMARLHSSIHCFCTSRHLLESLMIERESIVPINRSHLFYEYTVKPGFQQDCPIFQRETDADRHGGESSSRAAVARRLRPIATRSSRLPAIPRQRPDVLAYVCAIARRSATAAP